VFNRFKQLFTRSIPQPTTSLAAPAGWLWEAFGATKSDSGVTVTPDLALSIPALWQGLNILTSDFAKLPLNVYSETNGSRRIDKTHSAYPLLRRKPNPLMTAFQFKKALFYHALMWGNGYAYIERDASARPTNLILLWPTHTHVQQFGDQTFYVTQIDGKPYKFLPEDVLHLRGLSFGGLMAYSVVRTHRQSLGLSIAAEKFGSKFYANGATASGVLQYPGQLKGNAATNLAANFDEKHRGLDNAHRTILLEEGAKWVPMTVPQDNAQFLETREFQVREVARILNMPPHKLGDATRVSYSSLEQENQSYLDSSLDPWLVAFEEECFDKLLTEAEKAAELRFIEFDRSELLRADQKSRYDAYAVARQWGFLSANDIRRSENLDSIGDQGDIYLTPINMASADQTQPDSIGADGSDDSDDTGDTDEATRGVLVDVLARMARREGNAARRTAEKPADFTAWLHRFCDDTAIIRTAITPALQLVYATRHDAPSVEQLINSRANELRGLLVAATEGAPDELTTRIDDAMTGWETSAPSALAAKIVAGTL
jgi:HK97 family phage portal protein